MRIIGTAGHVDHGKSTLVRALTGIDPDRLKEEKAREMTIDLGFAHFDLPGIGEVSIIDVPGHRDFIENMLAGVGGIEAVMLVVAADEGIMPQTREHLAILDLLAIPAGVVALTKIDRVDDPDWLELVTADLREALAGTVLAEAPIVPVSARTGQGLDALRTTLQGALRRAPGRPDRGQPRLWVDRVFTIGGFGTVVTGTLLDGQFAAGQEVEIFPTGLRARIRGLQANGRPHEWIGAGSRAALNLTGIERKDVQRGHRIGIPGGLAPTRLIDVSFRHLRDASRPLKHGAEVKFFCGAAEAQARVRLLGDENLGSGAEGWLQIELAAALPLVDGERFILRHASPGETIGGGQILDAHPGRRWRRNRPEVIERLQALARGEPLPDKRAERRRQRVLSAIGLLRDYHRAEPLRSGMASETLRSRLGMEKSEYRALLAELAAEGQLRTLPGGLVSLPDHTLHFNPEQQAAIDSLLKRFAETPAAPPSMKDAEAAVGEAILHALLERGDLIALSSEVLFLPGAFRDMAAGTRELLDSDGAVTIKTVRDRFGTSRKYAQAFLEYLDQIGLTRRQEDNHVIGSGDWTAILGKQNRPDPV